MAKPSEPMLALLRTLLERKGMNTAQLASATKLKRQRVRRVLSGKDAMTVDELLLFGTALDLSPSDLGMPSMDEDGASPIEQVLNSNPEAAPTEARVDRWGNQPRQLFEIGFALGCDFFFLSDSKMLDSKLVPAHILSQYDGRDIPIKLDATYHQHNNPRYTEAGVTLTLSFDQLYECTFPWVSIRQVIFFPADPTDTKPEDEDEPEAEEAPKRPHLRLVT
jgi:transcriptional regulator with XRE-family HTH domain